MKATLKDLLDAIFEAEKHTKNGYDVLASNEWDRIMEQARGIAVLDPLTEMRMLIECGSASRPSKGCNFSITLWFTGEEIKRLCELLGQGKHIPGAAP